MESIDTGGGCRVYRCVSLSTQKLHLNAKSVPEPTLFLGCHQYKYCCVSISVEVILSAVELYLHPVKLPRHSKYYQLSNTIINSITSHSCFFNFHKLLHFSQGE